MNPLAELRRRFQAALAPLVDDTATLLEMIRPAQDARFGDYQANLAMPLGKKLGKPPREIAQQIVQRLDVADLCDEPEIAGPGFINLRLRTGFLVDQLSRALGDERLGVGAVEQRRTYVLDYSSPNVAKPMHVGHIRSTVIGDALCRMLRYLGHQVISDNHLGDWGTQFGMIIYGYKHFVDEQAYEQHPVRELGRLYKQVSQLVEYEHGQRQLPQLEQRVADRQQELEAHQQAAESAKDKKDKKAAKTIRKLQSQLDDARHELRSLQDKLAAVDHDPQLSAMAAAHRGISEAVLRETAKLHEGDPENRQLWERFLPRCRQDIQQIYDRLDVKFDVEYGESHYEEMLADVVRDLEQRGLARESEGAMCVFLDDFETPMIVRKQDGAFLYATTDLATIRFRLQKWDPDAMLYVVDHRQSEHFAKLFEVARRCGCEDVELRHISFGTVLGEDGRPYKTRSGTTVGLEGLLDEAVQKAYTVVCQNDDAKPNGPELSEEERRHVAQVVGHAAIKYADLSHNRTSDYVFSYEKMMALEGNTATYMQYSYARTQGIFARGGVELDQLRAEPQVQLEHPSERTLALHLLRFAEALDESLIDYRPNQLTSYLFDLARAFSDFYQQCPVLKAETPEVRDSRLRLCDLTGRTIRQGLNLLGIQVVDKM